MNNIKILKTGININSILNHLNENLHDWNNTENIKSTLLPDLPVSIIQLKIGLLENPNGYVGDSELSIITNYWKKYHEIIELVNSLGYSKIERCAFLLLPVGGKVGSHIDKGVYYKSRDRFHLSIQGKYVYEVEGEEVVIHPGTLFWFNNKLNHRAENIGDVPRITFVFDVVKVNIDILINLY